MHGSSSSVTPHAPSFFGSAFDFVFFPDHFLHQFPFCEVSLNILKVYFWHFFLRQPPSFVEKILCGLTQDVEKFFLLPEQNKQEHIIDDWFFVYRVSLTFVCIIHPRTQQQQHRSQHHLTHSPPIILFIFPQSNHITTVTTTTTRRTIVKHLWSKDNNNNNPQNTTKKLI